MGLTTEHPPPAGCARNDPPGPVAHQGRTGSSTPLTIALLLAAAALTLVVYWGAFAWWVGEWTSEGSFYAHGVFIPFFVAIMVWRDKERLRRIPVERCWWGVGVVALALIVVLASMKSGVTVPLSLSFILYLIGVGLVVAGKRITRALLFPVLFLSTMIPLVPDQLINPIALPIQLISAKMAATLSSFIGFSATVVATKVKLTSYTMEVELPCSGFKTLLGLVSFSAAFAYVVQGKPWKRWALFAMSAPLAIIINGLRITLIGIVGEVRGKDAAGTFHDYSGFIVLVLAFAFLFNVARLLRCESFLGVALVDPPKEPRSGQATGGASDRDSAVAAKEVAISDKAAEDHENQAGLNEKWGPPRHIPYNEIGAGLIPVIALLALTVVAQAAIRKPNETISAIGTNDIPVSLPAERGHWNAEPFGPSTDIPIPDNVKVALKPISYVNRIYNGLDGRSGTVEMLLISGTSRKVFHDPHTCLVVDGAMMRDLHTETIETPNGPLKAMLSEVNNDKLGTKHMMMVCYLIGGKQYQTTQESNTAIVWQQLFGDDGRASYFLRFRQMTPGYEPERVEELKSFVKSLWADIGPKMETLARKPQAASR